MTDIIPHGLPPDSRARLALRIIIKRQTSRSSRAVSVAGCMLMLGLRGSAAEAGFKALRYDEDYSMRRTEPARAAFSDRLKFITHDAAGAAWLTLGGESRSRYEYFSHTQWGAGPQDTNGYFLQRTMLHADWHSGGPLRGFVQLKSGLEAGRSGGPRLTDEDRLDLAQAFIDARWPAPADTALSVRLGRQEIALGSSRLVSTRETPNVRLAFDGVRFFLEGKGWRIDAMAVRPVQTKAGGFDDGTDLTQKLWGLYAVAPLPKWNGANLDVYYLGYERESGRFAQGSAHETRQTFGSRLWRKSGDWEYNAETVLQFGDFGADRIRAWMASLDASYTWAKVSGKPRLGVRGGVASGDRDPSDATLGTYNGLFPRGAYYHEISLIGPANIIAVHPSLTLQPAASVSFSLDCDFFWRESDNDGVYGTSVNLLRAALTTPGRNLGTQPSLRLEWRPTRHWLVAATVARFYAGEVIRGSGPGRDVDYFSAWTTYTF